MSLHMFAVDHLVADRCLLIAMLLHIIRASKSIIILISFRNISPQVPAYISLQCKLPSVHASAIRSRRTKKIGGNVTDHNVASSS